MRTFVLVLGVLALHSVAAAEERAIEIPFAPGPSGVYDVRQERTRTSSDERGPNGVGRVTATIEIQGSAAPFLATWTTNSVEADGITLDRNSPASASYLIGIPVRLSLNETGAPQAIEDWSGFRQRVFEAARLLLPEGNRGENSRRALEATERMFASMSAENAAQTLFPDLSIASLCQHTGLVLGEPLRSEAMTPNVLGGPPIRTQLSWQLLSVDREQGTANILFTSTLDPESATASVLETVRRIVRESGRSEAEVMAEMGEMRITHDANARCVVDVRTGVTRSVEHEVRITAGPGVSRSDRRIIVITPRQ